jgi:KUP system potassium uptake protein
MSDAAIPQATPAPTHVVHGSLGVLSLGALGIVFGDIGTSPLYTLHECTSSEHGIAATPGDILGVLSLIFWSLTMVVTVKYLTFIMRADNHGEGGIFALLALIPERMRTATSGKIGWVAVLVIVGAALLYGDGMITPAISVLSAMEGLEVATPALKPLVIPATCLVLFGLFAIQRRGTGGVGALFGPVMVVWFLTIGGLGAYHLAAHPAVLAALNPIHAAHFFLIHGGKGFLVLGSVVLAVTGGEALYADMGHFGSRPIRVAWLALVMPSLVLCYFGQGALMLTSDAAKQSPFFAMVPAGAWTYALVVLSTMATVIASQALISARSRSRTRRCSSGSSRA